MRPCSGRKEPAPGRGRVAPAAVRLLLIVLGPLAAGTSQAAPSPPSSRLDDIGRRTAGLLEGGSFVAADSLVTSGLSLADSAAADTEAAARWWEVAGVVRHTIGRDDDAALYLRRALALDRDRGPAGMEAALTALQQLHEVYVHRKDLAEAERCAEEGMELATRLYGSNPRIAHSETRLAFTWMLQDRLTDADTLLARTQRLIETYREEPGWGPDHWSLDYVLRIRARLAARMGRYDDAIGYYRRSITIKEQQWGKDCFWIWDPLSGLASVYGQRGDLREAEDLYRRSLHIVEIARGAQSPLVAQVSSSLAGLLHRSGRDSEAIGIERVALRILERAYGDANPNVAKALASLAASLGGIGDYAEAIRSYQRAARIMEGFYGPDHSETAAALGDLAGMLLRHGEPEEAERISQRSLAIAARVYGSPHPETARLRFQLGACQSECGRPEEARRSMSQAVTEARVIYGTHSHKTAAYECGLAELTLLQGRASEGRAALERVHRTLEGQLPPGHPLFLRCFSDLAAADIALGRPDSARAWAQQEEALCLRTGGSASLERAGAFLHLLAAEAAAGRMRQAVREGARAAEVAFGIQEEIYPASCEREAILHARLPQRAVALLLSAMAKGGISDSSCARAFMLAARAHGQVFRRWVERQRYEEASAGALAADRRAYAAAARRLANLVVRGPGEEPDTWQLDLSRARAEKEEAERELAEAGESGLPADRPLETALAPEALARGLKTGSLLLHFVRFPADPRRASRWRPGASALAAPPDPGPENYGCFRLDSEGRLAFIDLGAAAQLDSLIRRYRLAVEAAGPSGRPSARTEALYRRAARDLYEAVWQPLFQGTAEPAGAPAGSSPPLLFIVPESSLYLADFNTLLAPSGRLVIEDDRIHILSSASDLLRFAGGPPGPTGRGMLAVGNVRPGTEGAAAGPAPRRPEPAALCPEAVDAAEPLPGSEREAREAGRLFDEVSGEPVHLLLGRDATRHAILEAMKGKRIVHLATHGFYCGEAGEAAGHDKGANPPECREAAGDVAALDNPLLLSGLIVAEGDQPQDGILTAQEVLGQDLRGVQWVVLSACRSGLGRLLPGEGISGLRRAFEISGASTVLFAIWRLRDDTGERLMERIYSLRLEGGVSTVDAVRQAELEQLLESRSLFHRIHPALWAGVMAEGDWH